MKKFTALSCSALIVSLVVTAVSVLGQQAPRGITPEDYYAFEFLSDPNISPDGKLVAYVVTKVDRAQNRRNSSIWMVATDGNRAPWQFTTSPQSSNSPRWSPDGKSLAFLSSRPESTPAAAAPTATPAEPPRNQVYLLSMNGGEARRITNLKNGVSLFRWSPDGSRFAVVSRIGPSDSRAENRDRSDVRHYKNSSYKFNDTGWFDDRRTHLWVVDVKSGSAKQVTEGNDWNDSDPQWSPDGARIAFVSNRTGREYDENRNTDVWVISAEGGPLTKISDHDEADNQPRWSPDGKWIAFTGEVHVRDHPKIWLAPATGGFMTNWILGHTDRFKAAVTLRSVSNFISDDGTRDGAYGHAPDFSGDIFQRFDFYWERSPLKYAKNVKTPTLILHSDNDYRVPIEQGEQWFRALKHFGVTTEIVFFPRENHNLTRTGEPKHLIESMNWQLYWFDKFLNGKTSAVPPDAK